MVIIAEAKYETCLYSLDSHFDFNFTIMYYDYGIIRLQFAIDHGLDLLVTHPMDRKCLVSMHLVA